MENNLDQKNQSENQNEGELLTNSDQMNDLKSSIDKMSFPAILCTNIKPDNPHFLGIIKANDSFCKAFKVNKEDLVGKSYDFLFENQETDYSSEDQIEFIKLINAIKSNKPCSITQTIRNIDDYSVTNYKITLTPVLNESEKRYQIISFEEYKETHSQENGEIKNRHENIGSKNQELVKSLERALSNEKVLREISYQIISDKPVQEIAKNICESICEILKVDRCLIYDLKDSKINSLVEFNNSNKDNNIDHGDAFKYIANQNEFYKRIKKDINKTSIFVTNDVTKNHNSQEYQEFYDKYNIASQICALSFFNNESNGGIYIFSSATRNPTIDEVEMIEIITDQLSIAIERSNSIEKIVTSNQALVKKTEELKKSVQKEKEAREMQSKFIALVSHEFKTPLQIIDSSRELMSRKIKSLNLYDESFEKYATRVKNAIKRMTNLINSTLNLSKIEENESGEQISINKEDFNLHKLLDDVIEKISDLLIKRNVSLKKIFSAQDDLINADPGLLEHCLSNIISNAIKYSKKDTEVKIATRLNEDNTISVIILDQGIGIPQADIDKIGQKFFRSSNTLAESGSGIGLYLTKYFIELHNGDVTIESKENIGTKVTITLPKK